MKRLISILSVALLCLTLVFCLTGCSGSDIKKGTYVYEYESESSSYGTYDCRIEIRLTEKNKGYWVEYNGRTNNYSAKAIEIRAFEEEGILSITFEGEDSRLYEYEYDGDKLVLIDPSFEVYELGGEITFRKQ